MTKTTKDFQQAKQEAEHKITNFVNEVIKELQKDFEVEIFGVFVDTVSLVEIETLKERCKAFNTEIAI